MEFKPHWASKVWVDKDEKYSYFLISKNASMSFRRCGLFGNGALKDLREYDDVRHLSLINIAVFREPISRLISAYLWVCGHSQETKISHPAIQKISNTKYFKNRENIIESFEQYIEVLNTNHEVTRSQTQFIHDRGVELKDIQVKMLQEYINEDFIKFKTKYGLNIKLIHINKTNANVHLELKTYIENTAWIQNKIKNIYEDDFELYYNILNERI